MSDHDGRPGPKDARPAQAGEESVREPESESVAETEAVPGTESKTVPVPVPVAVAVRPSGPAATAEPPRAPTARARGLVLRDGRREVFSGDLELPSGAVTALLGPEGSGKTALLRVLLGIDARAGGELSIFGVDPAREPLRVRQLAGYVPERAALYATMTAVGLGRFYADVQPAWQMKRYIDHLARLGVPPRHRVADLSPSLAARLALALALGHAPRLLVVDVPHDLDALGRHELLVGVDEETTTQTVLLATSRPHEVARLAEHVIVIAGGRVRFAGPTASLLARCRRLEVTTAEPPALPAGVEVLHTRPATPRRAAELVVLGPTEDVDLTAPGVSAHPVTLEEAYLALVAGSPETPPSSS